MHSSCKLRSWFQWWGGKTHQHVWWEIPWRKSSWCLGSQQNLPELEQPAVLVPLSIAPGESWTSHRNLPTLKRPQMLYIHPKSSVCSRTTGKLGWQQLTDLLSPPNILMASQQHRNTQVCYFKTTLPADPESNKDITGVSRKGFSPPLCKAQPRQSTHPNWICL